MKFMLCVNINNFDIEILSVATGNLESRLYENKVTTNDKKNNEIVIFFHHNA